MDESFHPKIANLPLGRSKQFEWYYNKAGQDIAWKFFATVDLTLSQLSCQPDLGYLRRFRSPSLQGFRSFRTKPPFGQLLIFYRFTPDELIAERLIHGARDLPRRLAESANS